MVMRPKENNRVTEMAASHNQIVVDQFGKQAAYFARLPGHEEATRLLIEAADLAADDEVLDVACGPGLVACAVAPHVRHVVGVDLTPAMIDQARALQLRQGLSNLDWHIGDVSDPPFASDWFSAVLTRYSLHHFVDPERVLLEMVRVATPGGRVVVADLVLPPEHGRAYDCMERLRDPSHVRVLSNAEVGELMARVGLVNMRWAGYLFELQLSTLLRGSFPRPGDADRVREMFEQDVGANRLGIGVHQSDGEIRFAYRVTMIVVAVVNARHPRSPRFLESFSILSGPALAATGVSISRANDHQQWHTRDDRPRNDLCRAIRNANRGKPDSRTEERHDNKQRPQAELKTEIAIGFHRRIIRRRGQHRQEILLGPLDRYCAAAARRLNRPSMGLRGYSIRFGTSRRNHRLSPGACPRIPPIARRYSHWETVPFRM
jgi:ubiquinone/menaquinone biosynthesis C-methylase UbiE